MPQLSAPTPKMKFIKPAVKTVGRYMDLTEMRRDICIKPDWESVPGEFAGAVNCPSPDAIFRGERIQFSVPVDQPFEDPPQSYKCLIRGIPSWLDSTQVYFCLMIYLARYHLIMLSGVEFVQDTTQKSRAAWIVIDRSEEAYRILDSQKYRLTFNARAVFSLPASMNIESPEVTLVAYENN